MPGADAGAGAPQQIGRVAEDLGLSIRTLRHWDEVGLVPPSVRSAGGYRLYTADDVDRLRTIRRMKPLGFTLEEMTDLLAVLDALQVEQDEVAVGELRARVSVFRDTALERRAKMVETLARADEFIDVLTRY